MNMFKSNHDTNERLMQLDLNVISVILIIFRGPGFQNTKENKSSLLVTNENKYDVITVYFDFVNSAVLQQ